MSRVVVITPPAKIMTAAEVKSVMPALAGVADAVVDGLVAAATAEIDGPAGWLGRAIGVQTLELQRVDFPCGKGWIALPYRPIVSVAKVAYDDTDGEEIVIDEGEYHLRGGALALKSGFSWPSATGELAAVRIQYVAGYPEGQIPAPIMTAVQLRVGSLHSALRSSPDLKKEVVEGIGSKEWRVGSDGETATDKAIASLLAPFRIWNV